MNTIAPSIGRQTSASANVLRLGFLIVAAMAVAAAVYAASVTATHAPVFEECYQQCAR